MRGHWLSGTRKLNRHYQSGGGGGSIWTTFTGMYQGLIGLKVGGSDDTYNTGDTTAKFYQPSSDNVQAAPLYELWDTTPSSYTIEQNVPMVYGNWGVNALGIVSASSGIVSNIPVFRYGLITPQPKWAYSNYRISWYKPTTTDSVKNQNGIDRTALNLYNTYSYYNLGTNYTHFETAYNGIDIKVLQPVYELVAIPENTAYKRAVSTNQGLSYTFSNDIKVKDMPAGLTRVGQDGYFAQDALIHTDNNKVYLQSGTGGFSNGWSEVGALSGIAGHFAGDKLYVIIEDVNGDHIVAGTYNDGISTMNMVFAIRLDHIEIASGVEPANDVVPLNIII